jgi:purine-binding chemotaxis protein CheW
MNRSTGPNSEPLKTDSPVAGTYCTFLVRGGLFGVDALAVKEITAVPPLTPIPHAPEAVRGYVNLRGQIVLVLDSQGILHGGEMAIGPETRIVVFRAHLGDPFGMLVDSIGDIVELSGERIERPAYGATSRDENGGSPLHEELFFGIGKLDRGLLTILDAGKLLPHLDAVIEQYRKKAYH